MGRYLVVGGDGGIGQALFREISSRSRPVIRTTRRQGCGDAIFLDLAEPSAVQGSFDDVSFAFLCAAISGFADCERDAAYTRRVNVDGVLEVARALLDQGAFVVFLSTSAVFDGTKPWPDEAGERAPTSEYGRQKALAERSLLEMDGGRGRVAVVRLTKVLTRETPVIKKMLDKMQHGEAVEAFSDLKISPVSMEYVVNALLAVAEKRAGGVFHFSGENEISYVELAGMMAAFVGADPGTVREAGSSGAVIHFRPEFPGLGMERSRDILGLQPEPIEDVFKSILSGLK